MISRKPLGNRNGNDNDASLQEGVSPQKKKKESPVKRSLNFDADSAFVSPETICRPKLSSSSLTGSRRSSPFSNSNNASKSLPLPFSSFRLEDSPKIINDVKLPSAAIADLWNKPLKLNSSQSQSETENSPKSTKLCSPKVTSQLPLSKTKLTFDLFSQGSPPPLLPSVSNQRRSLGYRRSLSCASQDTPSKKNIFPLLNSEGPSTPFFKPKRHKFGNDENSPSKKKPSSSSTSNFDPGSTSLTPEVKRLSFFRSQSESALTPTCSIKNALERIESNPNLIGDGSKSYALPCTRNGKHRDLKEISGVTLAQLLRSSQENPKIPTQLQLEGQAQGQDQSHQKSEALASSSDDVVDVTVSSFKVIDCRYPYEYDGGHIKGAINLFTKNQIYQELIQPKISTTKEKNEKQETERNILIFHCEFSSQRGPEMCRYLRDMDRDSNMAHYPKLFYPEMYVLFGGYKLFFEQFPNLCDPPGYLPMDHPSHIEDCRRFKSQTKLERPTSTKDLPNKSKSQGKFQRNTSFPRKCNF